MDHILILIYYHFNYLCIYSYLSQITQICCLLILSENLTYQELDSVQITSARNLVISNTNPYQVFSTGGKLSLH